MQITRNTTVTLRIADIMSAPRRLDPVTAYLDDIEPGKGTLTVRCWDRAWTCYWGGMGEGLSISQFLRTVDAGYVANCLVRGNRSVITNRAAERREEAYLLRIAEALIDAIRTEAGL